MANLYTMKVYPEGRGKEAYRIIEIGGNKTLDNLCETIMDAFDFIHEHLYEFCMDNKMYGNGLRYEYMPEGPGPSTKVMSWCRRPSSVMRQCAIIQSSTIRI